jgi:serine/threonine-protein kinase HipA
MNTLNVTYLDAPVGILAETRQGIAFEFAPAFLASGHDLSPLNLPLRKGLHQRDGLGSTRLLGLFEDSLPDRWGSKIMAEWFRKHGVPEHAITPLAQLAYVGSRGMGALTYEPAQDITETDPEPFSLGRLFEAAEVAERGGPIDLNVLAPAGSPAGGARPKALIALATDVGGPVVAGEGAIPPGYDAWLVKFSGPRDPHAGVMEQAYALMARAAGIDVPETRLLATEREGVQSLHFAVKRFDRSGHERTHHHTLAGLTHALGGDLCYETLLRATRRITHDEAEVWRAFRRAVFNVLASNRDDHGKNHGFIYAHRQWKLGPAYDLTFASQRMLPERGMSIAGERRTAGIPELMKLAQTEALDRAQAHAIVEQTRHAVSQWREFAAAAGVPEITAAEVGAYLNKGPAAKR